MNGPVLHEGAEHVVHAPVLVDQGKTLERLVGHVHLEMVAAAAVDHAELVGVRERLLEEGLDGLGAHDGGW